jgi:hypothetical protein
MTGYLTGFGNMPAQGTIPERATLVILAKYQLALAEG